ncbi:FIVAR domain-containing protein [[Mycoplasma] imitans]|uniref:FIVAR domain-containing protein n=1 Tax=[Mycoplasma] imitans TaxID=29560 RepID=UPI000488C52E|nr:FIVAR domain-containing protein [[Mycoplasma] imitans]
MKRKNILKFISLLGVGSFVSLAVASCGQAATQNPINPGNGGQTPPGDNTDEQKLAEAKMTLNTSLSTKSANVELYANYAKIQNTLNDAYATAEAVSSKSNATLTEVENATTALKAAIDAAAKAKTDFDSMHGDLVTAYNNLKTTLDTQTKTLEDLSGEQFSSINSHLTALYKAGQDLATKTLTPADGGMLNLDDVKKANNDLTSALNALPEQRKNAATLFNKFIKMALTKTGVTGTDSMQSQPYNYSYVGYSVDLTSGHSKPEESATSGQSAPDLPNWNFATRTVWNSTGNMQIETASTTESQLPAAPLTDVSWIYSLTGTNTKYTLTFDYFGPTNAFLYFPYKLVKTTDNETVGLQYKLNENTTPVVLSFGTADTDNGKTPTVSDINVAKVALSGLKYGSNKLVFTAPSDKVAPMIGNMYLTTSDNEVNKQLIENSIFGNEVATDNKNSITVNFLTGYSLATDVSTYIGEYTGNDVKLDNQALGDKKIYLVGYAGGTNVREVTESNNENKQTLPKQTDSTKRTVTIYVNAPEAGEYFVKGTVSTAAKNVFRDLIISKDTSNDEQNQVKIKSLRTDNNNTIITFDTSAVPGNPTRVTTEPADKKTLTLTKGLNKVVVSSNTTMENKTQSPNIGNLTFTLKSTQE